MQVKEVPVEKVLSRLRIKYRGEELTCSNGHIGLSMHGCGDDAEVVCVKCLELVKSGKEKDFSYER